MQMLATEMIKTENIVNTETLKSIFDFVEPAHHLQSNNLLERYNAKSVMYGTETISHLQPFTKYLR